MPVIVATGRDDSRSQSNKLELIPYADEQSLHYACNISLLKLPNGAQQKHSTTII